jgi:hypothetical protein
LIAASLRMISLIRLEALELPAARRRERLAEVDERLGAVQVAAPDRHEHAEDRPEHEAADGQPPARGDARPRRLEVDLALGVEVDATGPPHLAHGAGTLPAT